MQPQQQSDIAKDLLTVTEFLQRHSMSKSTFYRLCQEGHGPQIRKLGKRSLIAAKDAAAWLEWFMAAGAETARWGQEARARRASA